MILCIDAGNTRVKWGLWASGQWRQRGSLPGDDLGSLAEVLALCAPSWIGISCVAKDAVRERIADAVAAQAVPVHWLKSAAVAHGIDNRYSAPESLGVDRFAALIGARRLASGPSVVVHAGTALCLDALTEQGVFLGGMILPGADLLRRALAAGTAGVQEVSGTFTEFPRSTGDAVETGIWTAMTATLMQFGARLEAYACAEVVYLLSGGDAARLGECLPLPLSARVRVVDGLVLEGLLWVARDLGVPGA